MATQLQRRRPTANESTAVDENPDWLVSGEDATDSVEDSSSPRPSASIGSGWDTLRDQRAKRAAGSAHRLQVKDKEVLAHFNQPEPFAVYNQHWVGQRSYSCPGSGCPLCEQGIDTRTLALFNVTDMSTGENLFWEAGPNATKAVQAMAESERFSPIDRDDLYFAINRTKQDNGFFNFALTPVKARDLDEDWHLSPLTAEEIAEARAKLFDGSVIYYHSPKDLRAVAEGIEED